MSYDWPPPAYDVASTNVRCASSTSVLGNSNSLSIELKPSRLPLFDHQQHPTRNPPQWRPRRHPRLLPWRSPMGLSLADRKCMHPRSRRVALLTNTQNRCRPHLDRLSCRRLRLDLPLQRRFWMPCAVSSESQQAFHTSQLHYPNILGACDTCPRERDRLAWLGWTSHAQWHAWNIGLVCLELGLVRRPAGARSQGCRAQERLQTQLPLQRV
jgi:hypothetical protein